MAYIPFAPQLAAAYTITGPDGSVAVLNNNLSTNAAGVVTDLTGLDSADVVDSGGTLVQGDGGYTGTNWYGRRPITMSITTYGYPDVATRDAQISRLRRATNAMNADGTLSWTNTGVGAVPMHTTFRRQSPLRVTGGWVKTVSLALVSIYAPLLGNTINVAPASASVTAENQGDYAPGFINYITINGPTAGALTVTNTTTTGVIKFLVGMTVPTGQSLYIYPQQHIAYLSGYGYVNNYIDFVNSTWFGMQTGNNTFTTNSGTIGINYNSAWV